MNWESWKPLFRGSAAGVEEIGESIAGDSPADVFASLCDYTRGHLVYTTNDSGLSSALSSGTIACRNASDLVCGVILYKTGLDVEARPYGIHGGEVPVVTPPIAQAGVSIQNNLRDGGTRMLFTGGHSVASVDGTLYDLITGLSGGIEGDFLVATKGEDDEDGHPTLTCDVDGSLRTFTAIGGTTGNGLTEFRVQPPLG